eukprot:scaffold422807_cov86-Attheya_sp.AAC.1
MVDSIPTLGIPLEALARLSVIAHHVSLNGLRTRDKARNEWNVIRLFSITCGRCICDCRLFRGVNEIELRQAAVTGNFDSN